MVDNSIEKAFLRCFRSHEPILPSFQCSSVPRGATTQALQFCRVNAQRLLFFVKNNSNMTHSLANPCRSAHGPGTESFHGRSSVDRDSLYKKAVYIDTSQLIRICQGRFQKFGDDFAACLLAKGQIGQRPLHVLAPNKVSAQTSLPRRHSNKPRFRLNLHLISFLSPVSFCLQRDYGTFESERIHPACIPPFPQ